MENKWNKQHINKGRMVAYRPKLSERSRIGQVLEFDDKTAKVQFAKTKVVLKDDLTPIFSMINKLQTRIICPMMNQSSNINGKMV
jgi:hypothetical protein